MKQGQLACLGTIQHLKSKFGHGYTIEVKVSQSSMSLVESFFHSQDVDVKETTDSTGIFQSRDGTPAELFQLLEENKQRLKIETYSISQTTLEQIFLSFGEEIRVSNVC